MPAVARSRKVVTEWLFWQVGRSWSNGWTKPSLCAVRSREAALRD
jgi:hypothetical protein